MQIIRPAASNVLRTPASDHVDVELRDDLGKRNCRMFGKPFGSKESLLFARMPDKEDRSLRLHGNCCNCFGNLENSNCARSVIISAVADRIAAWRANLAYAVEVDVN